MEKHFKRLPKMKNGNQKVHPKLTTWKKQKVGKIQKK